MSTETSDKNVVSEEEKLMKSLEYELDRIIEKSSKVETAAEIAYLRQQIILRFLKLLKEREQDKKKIQELEKKYLHEQLAKEAVEELLECSVPKLRIKDIKEKIKLDSTIVGGRRNAKTLEYGIKLGKIKVCEELLEEGE